MRLPCCGVLWVCIAVAGCDDDESLPREDIGTDGPTDDDGASSSGTTSGTTSSPTTGPSTDPTTDPSTEPTADPSTDPTTDPTADPSSSTSGEPSDPCVGESANITQDGNVLASSVFDTLLGPAYAAELSVDGDISTSWFSAGPNEDGTESTYEWYTSFDHCIDGISVISNAMHANPDFHQGFGFESATVEIVDSSGDTVYAQDVDLSGSPDPDIVLEPGGVLGNQVILRLRQHESEDCGGFAELAIDGRDSR
ncbi:MAG: hypothetical protein ACE37F_05075 [Nannocystaceae bacterium]|nr:PT domain-containing protein [bacterium]